MSPCTSLIVITALAIANCRWPLSTAHSLAGEPAARDAGAVSRSCVHYNYMCEQNRSSSSAATAGAGNDCASEVRTCALSDDERTKRVHCFAAWTNISGVIEVRLQGCWIDMSLCHDQNECVGWAVGRNSPDLYYCCCDSDECNADFSWSGETVETTLPTVVLPAQIARESQLLRVLLLSLGPLLIITIFTIGIFLLWRCCQGLPLESADHNAPLLSPPSPVVESPKIPIQVQLLEIVSQGRFGKVHRGVLLSGDVVAVKVFALSERQSWSTEQSFYSQPAVARHECILRCIDTQELDSQLWLVTEYHDRGSLYDFLKANVVTWPQALDIVASLARGVAFLHSYRGVDKPSVAHRDLKSRNVLLKSDMKTCIADFGLATVLDEKMSDIHAQVGTKRYMAPEVLDGSINFCHDLILKIDIYSLGLILWELVSRCTAADGAVGEYRMPYEDEVGQNPSLGEMQMMVVTRKVRPRLPAATNHQGLAMVCTTIEECWDNDPEARLSAECVHARMLSLLVPASDLTDSSDKGSRSTESSTCTM